MEREARIALEARIEANRKLARHNNVAGAENIFVNGSKGRRFHRNGIAQPRRER